MVKPNSPRDFGNALEALADLALATGDTVGAQSVRTLATVFTQTPEKTTAATLVKLGDLPAGQSSSSEIGCARTLLAQAGRFASSVGGAKFAEFSNAFAALLEKHTSTSASGFASAAIGRLNAPKTSRKRAPQPAKLVRDEIIAAYNQRLEASVGTDRFERAFSELSADRSLTSKEIEALAKIFAKVSPRGRPKALESIANRHNAAMSFHEKARSRDGRSAA
jgi:hypothetical protein